MTNTARSPHLREGGRCFHIGSRQTFSIDEVLASGAVVVSQGNYSTSFSEDEVLPEPQPNAVIEITRDGDVLGGMAIRLRCRHYGHAGLADASNLMEAQSMLDDSSSWCAQCGRESEDYARACLYHEELRDLDMDEAKERFAEFLAEREELDERRRLEER